MKEEYVAKSKEIEDGVVVDFDEKGQLTAVEFKYALTEARQG